MRRFTFLEHGDWNFEITLPFCMLRFYCVIALFPKFGYSTCYISLGFWEKQLCIDIISSAFQGDTLENDPSTRLHRTN